MWKERTESRSGWEKEVSGVSVWGKEWRERVQGEIVGNGKGNLGDDVET